MTATTLANVIQTLQSDVIDILKADGTSISFSADGGTATVSSTLSAMKIVDGMPSELIRTMAFPLIIVHTPDVDDTRLTMTKFRSEITMHIEILDRREGNVRKLMDAVKSALYTAQSTTKGDGYMWYGRRVRSNINFTYLPNEEGGKPVWHASIFFTYLWTGTGS